MSVNESKFLAGSRPFYLSNRALGILGLVGAPMLLINLIITSMMGERGRFGHFFGVLYIGGWICSAIAMRRQRVTGTGVASAILFVLQIVLLVLAMFNSAQDLFGITYETTAWFYGVCDAAYPFSHLLMLVVATAVFWTGKWRGWKEFAPLACGLALPVYFAIVALIDNDLSPIGFGILTALAFGMLGLAVTTKD